MSVRSRALASLTILAALTAAPASAADEPSAREEFDRGLALADAGRYADAADAFAAAYRITPRPAVLYNLGQAEHAAGRVDASIETFARYLRDADESVPAERRDRLQALIDAHRAAHSSPPPGARPPPARVAVRCRLSSVEVRIDRAVVGVTPLSDDLEIEAGAHTVTFERPGYGGPAVPIDLAGGGHTAVACALTRSARLAPRDTGYLRVAPSEGGARVHVDDEPWPAGESRPIPAGTHRVTVAHEGFSPAERVIVVPPHESFVATLRLSPTPAHRTELAARANAMRAGAWVALGLSTASGLAGASTLVAAEVEHDDWAAEQAAIDRRVQLGDTSAALRARQRDNNESIDHVHTLDAVAVGLGVGAGVLVATAIALFVWGDDPVRYDEPTIGLHEGGLGVRF